jgi:hypothetical protein
MAPPQLVEFTLADPHTMNNVQFVLDASAEALPHHVDEWRNGRYYYTHEVAGPAARTGLFATAMRDTAKFLTGRKDDPLTQTLIHMVHMVAGVSVRPITHISDGRSNLRITR